MDDIFSLKNKVVVVTGAGKGIGYFLANELSKRSSTVYAIDKMFSKKKQKNTLPPFLKPIEIKQENLEIDIEV